MYKKYITKRGKKIGPYFYESVRQSNGTVKAVYLGNKEEVALQKLRSLKGEKQQSSLAKQEQSSLPPQPSQPLTREQQLRASIRSHEQAQREIQEKILALKQLLRKKIITEEVYQQRYHAFFKNHTHHELLRFYDNQISLHEQELLNLRRQQEIVQEPKPSRPTTPSFVISVLILLAFFGFVFYQQPLTGFFLLETNETNMTSDQTTLPLMTAPEQSVQQAVVEVVNITTNESMSYVLNISSQQKITSLKVSGSLESGGSVRIYLVNDNYLVYEYEEKIPLLQQLIDALSTFLSGITGQAIVESTGEEFFVFDEQGHEIDTLIVSNESLWTITPNITTINSIILNQSEGSMLNLSTGFDVIGPENITVVKTYMIDTTALNYSDAFVNATANGTSLYQCLYWDSLSGICAGTWGLVMNLTIGKQYSVALPSGVVAFIEGVELVEESFNMTLINQTVVEAPLNETSLLKEILFENACVDTCNITNFTGADYKLVIIVSNTTMHLDTVTYTFGEEEIPILQQQATAPSLNVSGKKGEKKITYSDIGKQPPKHAIKRYAFKQLKNMEFGDNWERVCESGSCTQKIFAGDKYFIKEDGSAELLQNALEQTCDNNITDLCVKAKNYRLDFKRTPAEEETIAFVKDAYKITFQPLQIRYVGANQEILLSSANPVHGYGKDNIYRYPAIFGPGTEMSLTYYPNTMKEQITFADRSLLQANNIRTDEGYLFIDYAVNLSANLSFVSSTGIVASSLDTISFFNSTSLDSETENIAILPQPFVVSNTSMQLIDYGLTQTTEGLVMSLRIPVSFFQHATYPVVVDPTISLNHTSIIFDGHVSYEAGSDCYDRYGVATTMALGRNSLDAPPCSGLEAPTNSRADIDWDITSVPKNADLVDVNLTLYVEQLSSLDTRFEFYHMDGNSSRYDNDKPGNAGFYEDMRNGTAYLFKDVSATGFNEFNLTNHTQFAPDVETILWLQQGWWSIGITTEESGADNPYLVTSEDSTTLSQAPIVTFNYDLPVPSIFLQSPANLTVFNGVGNITLDTIVYDNEPQIEEVVFYGSNKTEPDGDDIISIQLNVTNATNVVYNWTAPVWEPDGNTVLLLHFDNRSQYGENRTYIVDYSNESNNGTIVGNSPNFPLTNFNFTGGSILGGAVEFFGLDVGEVENITLGDQDELIGTDYTWMFWWRPRSLGFGAVLLTKESGGTGLNITQQGENLTVNADATEVNVSNVFVQDVITHVAITLDSSNNLRIYRDGLLQNTTASVTVTDNNVPFELGIQDGTSISALGAMDELVILNRTLTDAEVLNAYRLKPDTYTWFVNATDYSGYDAGQNMSEIRTIILNAVPYAILNAPANGSFVRNAYDNELNFTVFDDDLDTLITKVFGDNTSTPLGEHLLYYNESVTNGTTITFNWTAVPLTNETDMQILYHLDNQSLFGESSTVVYDFADNFNGTPQADAVANYTNEILAGVYSFDGTGDYIDTSCNFPCYELRNATYLGWAKTATTTGVGVLMGTYLDASSLGFIFGRDGTNFVVTSDGPTSVSATNYFFANEWLHFAVRTYANGTTDIFINGTFVQTGQLSAVTDITGAGRSFTIGIEDEGTASNPFNGDLDELAVINRTLTDDEIRSRYVLRAGKYFWFANVSDNYTENQSETFEFTINALPVVTEINLTPTNANTTDSFTCTYIVVDDDDTTIPTIVGDFLNFSASVESFGEPVTNGTVNTQLASGDIQGKNDQFTCRVIPNDGKEEGILNTSNTVIVVNSPPTAPDLIDPEHLNQTTNRTPSFDYNTSIDADNDELNYTLNLTCLAVAGGSCAGAGDDRVLNFTTNASGLSQELQFFIDDNYFYNWTVLAFDGDNESEWADPPRSINISTFVDIFLTGNAVQFGTRSVGESVEATSPDLIAPFILRNDGNVEIEVNLSENSTTSLFISTPAPTSNYLFRADNTTDEPGAFSWENSITTFTQVPRTPTNTTVLKKFNYTDTIDTAEIEINITVPQDEPSGYKESTIEFIGYYQTL
ncbi:hypothetical protein HYS50_02915 [Candidatus Woesearchaeota archaeon]|nr:hypothetical protein [Candidatus Woesearchaeota archaeon]